MNEASIAKLRELPFEVRVSAVHLLGLVPATCPSCSNYMGAPACVCVTTAQKAGLDVIGPEDVGVDDPDQAPAPEQEEGLNAREGEQEQAPEETPEPDTTPQPLGTCETCGEAIYDVSVEHDCTGASPDAE